MRHRAVLLAAALLAGCTRRHCGVASDDADRAAGMALRRDAETVAAMSLLGLRRSQDAATSDVFFLGYPNLGLGAVAAARQPWTGHRSGLAHTFAEDGDLRRSTCDGELRMQLDGRHAPLTAAALAADLDALLALASPTDVYTHAPFDGHPDHAEVFRQVAAALVRARSDAVLHVTLIHPEGTAACMGPSARRWPNPADTGDPFARFTPALDVTPPALPPCGTSGDGATSWGPSGPPDEWIEVPADMQAPDAERNLKWRVLSRYASQVDCARGDDGTVHASCGYMRAFVKRHEFFWRLPSRDGGAAAPSAGASGAERRVLVVAAHPDDEALGMAGVIARTLRDGGRVRVAVVTNGA